MKKEEAEARAKINVIAGKDQYIMVINETKLTNISSKLWLIYFIYAFFLSFYDTLTAEKVVWKNAKNISSYYNGYKATIVTYSYQKNIIIARNYGFFSQGLNVWIWGIDKKSNNVNISFYVKKKDYKSFINDSPPYHSIWFSNKKQADTIPFFGLRNSERTLCKLFLFLDIWKYNYNNHTGMLIICSPFLITYFFKNFKKLKQIKIIEIKPTNTDHTNIIFFIFIISIFVNILIQMRKTIQIMLGKLAFQG